MEYSDFIEQVEEFEFVRSRDTADAATKAVLGILVSQLDEAKARKMTDKLPEPLTLDRLRGHQVRPENLSFKDCVAEITIQFQISSGQAEELILLVLSLTREAVGDAVFAELEESLPEDWVLAMEEA